MPSPRSVKKDTPASLDTHLDAYSAKAAAALELEEGRRKRPGRGLATCSAAAAGMGLIPALSVDAAIVHNDNGGLGWNVKNGTTATHSFDFDAGGNDFFVKHLGNTGTVGDAATDGSIARLAGGGPLRAHRFAQSETISVGYANWAAASAWLYHPVFTSAQFGPGTNGYVGVRFDSSGTTVYGWIHIDSVGNPTRTVTMSPRTRTRPRAGRSRRARQ